MDYLSDSSGQNDNPDLADIQRLHAAWKNVRQKKQSDKKSVSSVKNAIHAQQQKNLEARLAMTEKQLAKARQNTALLMKKLSQAEEELQIRQFEFNKQKKLRQQKQVQNQELRRQLDRRIKEQSYGHAKENIQNNRDQLNSLRKKLQVKERQVDRLCLKIKSLELDCQSNGNEIKKLSEINENLRRQLSQSEHAMNQVYLNDHSKGAQLLELSEAQKTIQRLILLLRGTEEYRLLGQFAEQAQQIHFLSNIPKRMKNNNLNYKLPDKKKMCSCMEVRIDQRLLWTPETCYRIMLDMKIKYDSLTEDCIEQTLFELNKIWASKEESHVRRVKQYYQGEIGKLRKRSQMRYDEMVARKQIQRLKKQLSGAKNCKKTSKGASLQSLKNLGQYEDEVRIKSKQIKLLQERIRLLQSESSSSDKVLYLEGALWIIEKVLSQMDVNQQDLRTFETQFRQKIQNNLCTEDWIRSFKEFFETITEINNGLIERLMSMRESTLKKIAGDKGDNFSDGKK